MGEIIEFPMERRQRDVDAENIQMEGQPISMDKCDGLIHVFAEVPGRCQCDECEWTPDHEINPPDYIGIHASFDPPSAS